MGCASGVQDLSQIRQAVRVQQLQRLPCMTCRSRSREIINFLLQPPFTILRARGEPEWRWSLDVPLRPWILPMLREQADSEWNAQNRNEEQGPASFERDTERDRHMRAVMMAMQQSIEQMQLAVVGRPGLIPSFQNCQKLALCGNVQCCACVGFPPPPLPGLSRRVSCKEQPLPREGVSRGDPFGTS